MNELHSIVLRDGSKASLSSFGANAFKNQGITRPKSTWHQLPCQEC